MEQKVIEQYNDLLSRIHAGEELSADERVWLADHPIESPRYGAPWIVSDMLPLNPGVEYTVVIQCQGTDANHPIVPTFTIPFEKDGFIKLESIVGAQMDTTKMRKSTKLSFRMLGGITIMAQCVSSSGLLMVSYQGWLRDHKPIPLWFESVQCDRFAMKKTVISENMVQYSCCGADGTEDAFRFVVNWYPA